MKKKRFIRLVMSYGVQRNEAAHMAARVGAFGTYEALFAAYRPLLVGRAAAQGVQRGFRDLSATAALAARRLRDFFTVAFGGVDLATDGDQSVVVHHIGSGNAGAPTVEVMTKEEHTAAHAAGRSD